MVELVLLPDFGRGEAAARQEGAFRARPAPPGRAGRGSGGEGVGLVLASSHRGGAGRPKNVIEPLYRKVERQMNTDGAGIIVLIRPSPSYTPRSSLPTPAQRRT